jgi:hypothetical protein
LCTQLCRLEASEASSPKATVRLVQALEDKLDNLAGQQVRGMMGPGCTPGHAVQYMQKHCLFSYTGL